MLCHWRMYIETDSSLLALCDVSLEMSQSVFQPDRSIFMCLISPSVHQKGKQKKKQKKKQLLTYSHRA